MVVREALQGLLWAPSGVFDPEGNDEILDLGRRSVGDAIGRGRPVLEASGAIGVIPLDPLVGGLARDLVAIGQLGNAEQILLDVQDESHSFGHG